MIVFESMSNEERVLLGLPLIVRIIECGVCDPCNESEICVYHDLLATLIGKYDSRENAVCVDLTDESFTPKNYRSGGVIVLIPGYEVLP
jgi:hypothetical protein